MDKSLKVIINNITYRPETIADDLPDNWQTLLTKRIIDSGNGIAILADSDIPKVWLRSTGAKYNAKKHPCVNHLRAFFLVCLTSLKIEV